MSVASAPPPGVTVTPGEAVTKRTPPVKRSAAGAGNANTPGEISGVGRGGIRVDSASGALGVGPGGVPEVGLRWRRLAVSGHLAVVVEAQHLAGEAWGGAVEILSR